VFPGQFDPFDLQDMDERDFRFWHRQAQIQRLTGQLIAAEAARIAQADKKDWIKATKVLQKQIDNLQRGINPEEEAAKSRERTRAAFYAQGKG